MLVAAGPLVVAGLGFALAERLLLGVVPAALRVARRAHPAGAALAVAALLVDKGTVSGLLACGSVVDRVAVTTPIYHTAQALSSGAGTRGMLGVRRQTVTVVAGALHNAGLIAYRRGVITVMDRPRLEEAACECYGTMRGYYRRVVA